MAEVETLPPRASLYDGLLMLVQGLLDMQQQLIRMDPEVAEKYLQYGELRRLELVKSEDMPRSGVTQALMRDRKSTRLNSSHVKISYAVFCLKKKTKRQP